MTEVVSRPVTVPRGQQFIAILWPAFIMAAAATTVFFAIFDPHELLAPTWFPELSRLGAYSVGFMLFWLLTATSSALTYYFQRPMNPPDRRTE